MLAAGTTLGPYKILAPLGAGGMGEVYRAEDAKHHRQVALKVLTPGIAAVVGAERFLREIEIAAKLTHPHILPVYDSGAADGLLYYVMPYVEGESLRQRLTREKQLPVDDALRIAREVADALSYAHSRGVVHRDIKPENILLESGHAVVADFGIARAIAAAGGEALTQTGVVLGTPAYMSPEQAAGSGDLDGRSDLYSLGCVLYEMLAGQPPFTGPTAESLAHQHLSVSPRSVTELRPAVPAAVAAALQRALAKTPADRFNPVALFGEALGTVATGAAITAARPNRALGPVLAVLGATMAVVAVVAGFWITRVQRKPVSAHGRTEIAVLPFQNLSAEGPNAYFAGGLHEELLTQLAKVAALKVISRTSVMGYDGTKKPLKQIAAELGVGSIVEGSVQVAGNRLRVNVQLIDAATDEHLWAERYDRTLDDAFAIQSDVAQRIVGAVGAVLSSSEQRVLATAPTANAEAYRFYLQGREYFARGLGDPRVVLAAQMLDSAVVLDPDFALAYAALAKARARAYTQGYDTTPLCAAKAERAAQEALRLGPALSEAREALGWYDYWVKEDWAAARDQFAMALRLHGGSSDVLLGLGLSQRRLGQLDEALDALERARRLDLLSSEKTIEVGISLLFARRYPEAVESFKRAVALAPDQHRGYAYLAAALVARDRKLDDAIRTLRSGAATIGEAEFVNRQLDPNTNAEIRWLLPRLFPSGFARLSHAELGSRLQAYYVTLAEWHRSEGRQERQQVYADSALSVNPVARGVLNPALALALAGRREDAVRAAEEVLGDRTLVRDHRNWPQVLNSLARLYVFVGEKERAIQLLERWVDVPSERSVAMLAFDPAWRPLSSDRRFQRVESRR